MIYIVGDNGASAEGGPDGTLNEIKPLSTGSRRRSRTSPHLDKLGGPESEPHYPVGWAWAGNTPFQWAKQVASHLGGTRNPMVVSWPAKIKPDDKPRDAFLHLVDVVPTILEAAHIPMPDTVNGIKQYPLAGKSFLASFSDPKFQGRSEQYFEVFSNRSIYEDGWKANAQHILPWRQDLAPGNWDKDRWELYNLAADFSEANDSRQNAGQARRNEAQVRRGRRDIPHLSLRRPRRRPTRPAEAPVPGADPTDRHSRTTPAQRGWPNLPHRR